MSDMAERLEGVSESDYKKQKLDDSSATKEQAPENKILTEEEKKKRKLLYDSDGYSDDEERKKDTNEYYAQIEASGGFEVGYFPKLGLMGMIIPVSDPEQDNQLQEFSVSALDFYNKKHSTSYEFKRVVNATASGAGGTIFYITFFAAEGKSDERCFRAQVFDEYGYDVIDVISCDLVEAN